MDDRFGEVYEKERELKEPRRLKSVFEYAEEQQAIVERGELTAFRPSRRDTTSPEDVEPELFDQTQDV